MDPQLSYLLLLSASVIDTTFQSNDEILQTAKYNLPVRWCGIAHRIYWLIHPAALVLARLLYLLVVMFQTAASSVHNWKGSPWTLLLFELDPRIVESARSCREKGRTIGIRGGH